MMSTNYYQLALDPPPGAPRASPYQSGGGGGLIAGQDSAMHLAAQQPLTSIEQQQQQQQGSPSQPQEQAGLSNEEAATRPGGITTPQQPTVAAAANSVHHPHPSSSSSPVTGEGFAVGPAGQFNSGSGIGGADSATSSQPPPARSETAATRPSTAECGVQQTIPNTDATTQISNALYNVEPDEPHELFGAMWVVADNRFIRKGKRHLDRPKYYVNAVLNVEEDGTAGPKYPEANIQEPKTAMMVYSGDSDTD